LLQRVGNDQQFLGACRLERDVKPQHRRDDRGRRLLGLGRRLATLGTHLLRDHGLELLLLLRSFRTE